MEINDILLEWSYRLKKGYPTMEDGKFTEPSELKVLHEILKENGIDEMPSFVKSKTPISDNTILEERVNKDAIIDLIKKLDTDAMTDKGIQKLYNRIKAFTIFKPIRTALKAKGFAVDEKTGKFDIPKQVSNTLQGFLEDLPPDSYNTFINYIQDPKQQASFPAEVGWGELKQDIPDELDRNVLQAIALYTGQDERKRGVGMGEILMALVFDNITKPGKGDLYLNDGEFEVKGAGAILGGLSKNLPSNFTNSLESVLGDLGISVDNSGFPVYNDKKYKKKELSLVLSETAKDNPDETKEAILQLMRLSDISDEDAEMAVNLLKDLTPSSINRAFGLANFIQYAKKEKFTRFIAIDYGSGGRGDSQYIYAQGSPEEMAKQLYDGRVGFETASLQNLWPRIDATGGPSDTLKESEEELEY